MRFLPIFLTLIFVGCGDDSGPKTPPIEQWCDLDRPREDCEADTIIVNNGWEEAKALCETPCTRIRTGVINNGDGEIIKALGGFEEFGALDIRNADDSLKDLTELSRVRRARRVIISDNRGLKSLKGLENLVEVAPLPDSGFELTGDHKIQISDNPQLKSVAGLSGLKTVGVLNIYNNKSLETIDGINALTRGSVYVSDNFGLKRISGFDGLETKGGISLIGNVALTTIDAFQNMTELVYVKVQRNYALDECQIQRILDQLDEPPRTLDMSKNGKTCQ
ncbi:MAG: hypothetical protein R3E66_17090 [bacterium]